jgi:hypothetical protein
MEKHSRNLSILVDGSLLASIDTKAVAADYISFMQYTESLMHTESLEREANASGKTIKHDSFSTFGAIRLQRPKVFDETVNTDCSCTSGCV